MIRNLTPHALTVAGQTFQPSGIVPRVSVSSVEDGVIEGLPVVRTQYGAVEGLPQVEEGVTLVVSALVLTALAGTRPDCVAPDTSPASAIRNDAGQIVGVRRLTR
jgi:hypothetical protein